MIHGCRVYSFYQRVDFSKQWVTIAAHCLKDLAKSETTQLVVSGAKWCRSHVIIDL